MEVVVHFDFGGGVGVGVRHVEGDLLGEFLVSGVKAKLGTVGVEGEGVVSSHP